jgi:hypothetical protein
MQTDNAKWMNLFYHFANNMERKDGREAILHHGPSLLWQE